VGLRTRTSLAFAVLALLLSTSLALMTYQLTRRYLLSKREALATQQAVSDARTAARLLRDRGTEPSAILLGLSSGTDARPVLRLGDRWFAASVDAGRDAVPRQLQDLTGTRTQRQRSSVDGKPVVVVAVPIGPDIGVYYDVVSLTELRSTLRTLAIILTAAATITTLFGAIVGLLASRRVLRPIDTMAQAAVRIAAGDRDARLTSDDKDLQPFVESFNDMVDALQERIDREARFASDVSHELRTPLAATRAAIDVLDRRVDERARAALDTLRRQNEKFERLVLDLLEISRFDSAPPTPSLEPVDPAAAVRDLLARTGRTQVRVDVEASTPTSVPLDRRRLDRVLTNLLENADHYANGATRIGIAASDDHLTIDVDDQGPGIAPAERTRVFERFHRGEASLASTAAGTGLGLAIAAEHCRVLGGRLFVADDVETGTRFRIELPRS
jgi:two-component system sensor histidine kinase MtrB